MWSLFLKALYTRQFTLLVKKQSINLSFMISILSKNYHFFCISLTWTRCLVSMNPCCCVINSHKVQSPLNQYLIHSKAKSIVHRIPTYTDPEISNFPVIWQVPLVLKSPCHLLSVYGVPVWLSVSKSNQNWNQQLIWLQYFQCKKYTGMNKQRCVRENFLIILIIFALDMTTAWWVS